MLKNRLLIAAACLLLAVPAFSLEVELTIETLVPEDGVFITPVWVGFHNGQFDSYDGGVSADLFPGLEEIAEDGNTAPLSASFNDQVATGLDATVAGPNGTREVPVEEIPAGPRKTSLGKGEFVVDFILPERKAGTGDAYLRFIPRTEMDIAVVGVGICLTLDGDGTCTDARVALGAVAPTVLLVEDAAKALIGSKLDDAAMAALDKAAQAACNPIDDKRGTVAYRTKVSGVLARRTAAIAAERAKG